MTLNCKRAIVRLFFTSFVKNQNDGRSLNKSFEKSEQTTWMSANFWTFLTFLFEIQSSKMTSMYRLSPIISPETMVFDMPTTMYKLPMIQNSNNGDSSNQSLELSNVSIFISSLSWEYSVCNLTLGLSKEISFRNAIIYITKSKENIAFNKKIHVW